MISVEQDDKLYSSGDQQNFHRCADQSWERKSLSFGRQRDLRHHSLWYAKGMQQSHQRGIQKSADSPPYSYSERIRRSFFIKGPSGLSILAKIIADTIDEGSSEVWKNAATPRSITWMLKARSSLSDQLLSDLADLMKLAIVEISLTDCVKLNNVVIFRYSQRDAWLTPTYQQDQVVATGDERTNRLQYITVNNVNAQFFVGSSNLPQITVSAFILDNLEEPARTLQKNDVDFFAYMEDTMAISPGDESLVQGFAAFLLKMLSYDKGRRVVHLRKEMGFEMRGQQRGCQSRCLHYGAFSFRYEVFATCARG